MLNECLEGLNLRPDGTYADVTNAPAVKRMIPYK